MWASMSTRPTLSVVRDPSGRIIAQSLLPTEDGKIISQSILPAEEAALLEFVAGMRGTVHVAFEEGTQAQRSGCTTCSPPA